MYYTKDSVSLWKRMHVQKSKCFCSVRAPRCAIIPSKGGGELQEISGSHGMETAKCFRRLSPTLLNHT